MKKPSQMTFTPTGFEAYRKPTRRERFLAEMDRVVPWAELVALVKPAYAQGTSGPGRPPIPLERMLRIHFLQHWFNLSDPAAEEALYDVSSMRSFVGIDLGREPAPDETTVCKFRHLLEEHGLGKRIFEAVGAHLQRQGLKVSSGTIVDATIIAAPSSTKNAEGKRDPEMHQTKKGKDWHFGMKAHVGVDKKTKLIHSVVATPANVADGNVVGELLHGGETHVWGDAAYTGRGERIRAKAPKAKDFTQRRGRGYRYLSDYDRWINRARSRVRARVEHSIGVIKRIFGFTKVRYRGIAKNANRLFVTCALANLFIVRQHLFRAQGA
ncbi:MAG: IS5 family transposase [Gemmatimonadaceae bacterium]